VKSSSVVSKKRTSTSYDVALYSSYFPYEYSAWG
jgi:hypothetical protein